MAPSNSVQVFFSMAIADDINHQGSPLVMEVERIEEWVFPRQRSGGLSALHTRDLSGKLSRVNL